MADYPNWFAGTAQQNFELFLSHLAGKKHLSFLQVGVFTGDATVWLMENILTDPTSTLVDVDTWLGSPDEDVHMQMDFYNVQDTYKLKTKKYKNLHPVAASSWDYLPTLETASFDFIYIDGDHTTFGVLTDATNSWRLLRPGGILAFDDYTWGDGLPDQAMAPRNGIDTFLWQHRKQYDILEHGSQVWIKRHA